MSITKDMTVADVLKMDRALANVFQSHGVMCLGCPSAATDSIEEAAIAHHVDTENFVEALNEKHNS
jgi:hybrid cluster-associated redox disulfide protein